MACAKVGYTSVKAARRAHNRAGFRIRVYECEECGRLHVTNEEKRTGSSRPTYFDADPDEFAATSSQR